jgi:hypothetical protein
MIVALFEKNVGISSQITLVKKEGCFYLYKFTSTQDISYTEKKKLFPTNKRTASVV